MVRVRPCAFVVFDDKSRVMLVCACGKCLRNELARPVGVTSDGRLDAAAGTLEELFGWIVRRCPEMPMARPHASCVPRRSRPNLRVVR